MGYRSLESGPAD